MTEGTPFMRRVHNWVDGKSRDRAMHPDDALGKSYARFFRILIWATFVWAVAGGLAALVLYFSNQWHPNTWGPFWGGAYAGGFGLAIITLWFRSLIYVHHDAQRRNMVPALWVVICIFGPYLLGFLAYFLLRKPRPISCPECQNDVPLFSKFCSHCGLQLHAVCVKCGASLDMDVKYCAECGEPVIQDTSGEETA